MSNVLMLDLEGVLIVVSRPLQEGNYLPRPHSQEFVNECHQLFDQLYLNTLVTEDRALKIMRDVYGTEKFKFWPHFEMPYGKMTGYERFRDDTLIHIEDGSVENSEAQRCIELGQTYIPISHWGFEAAIAGRNDNELPRILNQVKEILQ